MKIIFLDIDGVLNVFSNMALGVLLDQTRVAMMRLLAESTNSKIVVSSTWRRHKDCIDRLCDFGLSRGLFHDDWRTTLDDLECRGDQIQLWLNEHSDVTNFVIIDDDSDMLESQMPHFVKTSMEAGFTNKHFQQAVGILNG